MLRMGRTLANIAVASSGFLALVGAQKAQRGSGQATSRDRQTFPKHKHINNVSVIRLSNLPVALALVAVILNWVSVHIWLLLLLPSDRCLLALLLC